MGDRVYIRDLPPGGYVTIQTVQVVVQNNLEEEIETKWTWKEDGTLRIEVGEVSKP